VRRKPLDAWKCNNARKGINLFDGDDNNDVINIVDLILIGNILRMGLLLIDIREPEESGVGIQW
jgi:hypothetical protein